MIREVNRRTNHLLAVLVIGHLFAPLSSAQNQDQVTITGSFSDIVTVVPLEGVNIIVTSLADTTWQRGVVSVENGAFSVNVRGAGFYRIQASFVGYIPYTKITAVGKSGKDLGILEMKSVVLPLDPVTVEAVQDRVQVRGDTTIYSAAAFKVNPDASAEDLIAKMPGIVVDEGSVEAQGEQVSRVLVDGREFFGDDPTAALRNLPAEVIDRVEVYDRLSDQAQFTGFDDGNSEKTINIVTLPGRSNGQFGKVYGGLGTEESYIGGGSIHMFDDERRISLIGLTNNVNQQNFTTEDLLGVVGNAGRRGSGGGRGARIGGGGRGGGGGRPGGGGRRGGGGGGGRPGGAGGGGTGAGARGLSSNPSNFLIGNQGGINNTNAIGLNYIDQWGTNTSVTGSYFFNQAGNETLSLVDRTYFLTDSNAQIYNEKNDVLSDNYNHRLTMRLTHTIDDKNSIIFTPRISLQKNSAESDLFGINTRPGGDFLSSTSNDFYSDNSGFTASGNFLFRHRFSKRGRTLSINVAAGINDRSGDSYLFSENNFADSPDSTEIVDQRTKDATDGYSIAPSLTYTEPIGSFGQLQLRYRPSWSKSNSERLVRGIDEITDEYNVDNPLLSSEIRSTVNTQRAGASYNFRKEKIIASVGLDFQSAVLSGDQTLPTVSDLDKTYTSLLPQVSFQYRFSRSNNLRLFYRSSTTNPTVTQLQDVIDNTNPLQLSSGNSALEQSTSHSVVARYNVSNAAKGTIFVAFLSALRSQNYIGNETFIAEQDEILEGGVVFQEGSQFTRPVNLDGQWNLRSFFSYGIPVGLIKSNLNLNAGYSYSKTPGLINALDNLSAVQTITAGSVVGSNISPAVDFTLTYRLNYNIVLNTLYPEQDGNYSDHRFGLRLNVMPMPQIVLNTTVNYRYYAGEVTTIGEVSPVWSAGVGYKFLRGNGGEIKLGIADILNQSINQGRTVNEFYIEDNSSNTLGRYVMLSFTYTLRNYRI